VLDGLSEIAEQIFDLPIRRGVPAGEGGLADHLSHPATATALGLVLYAHGRRQSEPVGVGGGAFIRMVTKLRTVFKEFF
jgi:cell division protein FtsA